ncbi:hypothetical protein [Ruegeria faecimaris]|uniref:hypothetical protein n=1 Tax=Ruegeria faecimaris TaxID=686389 RepID=UPI002490B653|nr:hypothetical protein [Ruegeria faecimaris]
MPKAASSSLQVGLFSRLTSHTYLGLYPMGNVTGPASQAAPEGIAFQNDADLRDFWKTLHHRPETPDMAARFAAISERWNRDSRPLLLSHEALTSCLFSTPNLKAKSHAAARAFGDVEILLVRRDALGWLSSQYRDHPFDPRAPTAGPAVSFDEWVQILLTELPCFADMLRPGSLESVWRERFDTVTVLDFAKLVALNTAEVARLAAALGQPRDLVTDLLAEAHENRGLSDADVRARRRARGFGSNPEPDDPDLFALSTSSAALLEEISDSAP